MCEKCYSDAGDGYYIESVALIANWLDTKKADWYLIVNIDILDMTSCENCILGQVFRTEAEIVNETDGFTYAWWLMDQDGIRQNTEYVSGTISHWRATQNWIQEINARRMNNE